MKGALFAAVVAAAATGFVLIASAPLAGTTASAQQTVNPADFSPVITNPLHPLSLVGAKKFEGTETDPDTNDEVTTGLESTLLPETKVIDGVTVAVLEERDFIDDVLEEVTLDYFAQNKDGSVWYFGEDQDNYENGQVVNHTGTWIAGVDGAEPGIYMPANPVVGQNFKQENAPGVAEDEAKVQALNETVTVPAGTYHGCLKTLKTNPLEGNASETKWHCPGVGLVKEQSDTTLNELISVAAAPSPTPTATAMPAATVTPMPVASPTHATGVIAPDTGAGGTASSDRTWIVLVLAAAGVVATAGGVVFAAARRTIR